MCLYYTGIYAALCLVRTTPPRDYPAVLFIALWPYKIMYFYCIRICINFVWYIYYVLGAVTSLLPNISAILTYRSCVLLLRNKVWISNLYRSRDPLGLIHRLRGKFQWDIYIIFYATHWIYYVYTDGDRCDVMVSNFLYL